jgi:predicted amidophosphoribosyltransferase
MPGLGVLLALAPPLCWGCGGLARRGEPLCVHCRGSLQRLAAEPVVLSGVTVWAPVAYAGPTRDLVRALKFRGARGVADAMAAQIAANAPPGLLDAGIAPRDLPQGGVAPRDLPQGGVAPRDLPQGGVAPCYPASSLTRPSLVPVPLHPRRLRSRGYNQAAEIARALALRTGLAVADCLARSGAAAPQVGRDRAERRGGPAGAMVMRPPCANPPGSVPLGAARVLLVDDVATTGATLAACRAALLAAGASDVSAVVFARTLGR